MRLHTLYTRGLVILILLGLVLLIALCGALVVSVQKEGGSSTQTSLGAPALAARIIERRGSQVPTGPGDSTTSSVRCSSNEQMVGGGYTITGHGISADDSYPSSQVSWVATLRNTTHGTVSITAYIDCLVANFSVGTKIMVGESTGTSGNRVGETLSARARCPTGSVLIGGGYLTETLAGTVDVSGPENDQNQWLVISHPLSKGRMQVQSLAICATAHVSAVQPRSHAEFTIPGGGDAGSAISCPHNTLLTSGGYAASDPSVSGNFYDMNSPDSLSASSPGPVTRWLVRASSIDSTPHKVTIWIVCLKPI